MEMTTCGEQGEPAKLITHFGVSSSNLGISANF